MLFLFVTFLRTDSLKFSHYLKINIGDIVKFKVDDNEEEKSFCSQCL